MLVISFRGYRAPLRVKILLHIASITLIKTILQEMSRNLG